MKDNQTKYPQLRFKGFTDPWVQRKAKDLFIPVNERNREDLPVLSVTQDQGVVFRNGLAIDIKYDESTLSSYKVIHPGDFVISLRSFQGGFELSNVLGISSPAYTIFDFAVPAEQDKLYWKTIFKTFKFIESLKTVTFGIRDGKSISFKEFGDLKLNYPSDVDEQRRIGEFFAKLDETIAANQRKLDLLKEQKKGYLQKMFPKNGAKVPELRLAGFADAWEQRKLGDYLSLPKKEKVEITNARDLMTLKLHLRGIEAGTGRETLSLGSTVYYKRSAGQFLYGKQNFFNGSMAIIPKKFDGKATSGDVPALDINGINSGYLYTYVSRHDYWKAKEGDASGTGSKRIHESTLLKFGIMVPVNNAEQQKIGSFFKQLDDTITLHQRKLEKLQELKKGYLQKMFC